MRFARFQVDDEGSEAPWFACFRQHWHVFDEDRSLFKEDDRVADVFAFASVEKDSSASWIAFILYDGDAAVAEFFGGYVSSYVVGIVRYAYLAYDPRCVLDLRREDNRLGVVILSARSSLCELRDVVHVRRANAAFFVWLKALEGVRVEQHRAAHGMRFRE